MKQKPLFLLLCPLFCVTVLSAQAFEGRITAALTRPGQTQTFTYTVGTNMLRIERNETNRPYARNLIALDSGDITLLFPHNRSFVRLRAADQTTAPESFPQMSLPPGGLPPGIGPNFQDMPDMPRMSDLPDARERIRSPLSGLPTEFRTQPIISPPTNLPASHFQPTNVGPANLPAGMTMPKMPKMPDIPEGLGGGMSLRPEGLPEGVGPQPQLSGSPDTRIPPANFQGVPGMPHVRHEGTGAGVPGGMPAMPMMPMQSQLLELKTTTDTTNLLGYTCTRYELQQRGEIMEIWATDKLTPFRLWLHDQPLRFGPRGIEEFWGELLQGKKLFPLLATLRFADGIERLRFQVQSIRPEQTEDEGGALFQPPAGYQELEPLPF